jgi:hypothetical protein
MSEQIRHRIGLIASLIALGMFVLFGTGIVVYGLLTGVGMFTAIFLVALKSPRTLRWCHDHPALVEIGSTLGTFFLFSMFGGNTATAGIAAAVVCLCCSAVLGFSKLGLINSWINQGMDAAEDLVDHLRPEQDEEVLEITDRARVVKKRPIRRGRDRVQEAIARAIKAGN